MKTTIKKVFCPIVGNKKQLSMSKLPTSADILRYYLWLENKYAAKNIYLKLMEIWKSTDIPIISRQSTMRLINKLLNTYSYLKKSFKRLGKSPSFDNKLKKFKLEIELIFDLTDCAKFIRVPQEQKNFLINFNLQVKKPKLQHVQGEKNTGKISFTERNTILSEEDNENIDPNYTISEKQCKKSNKLKEHNTINISKVAIICDRYKVSDRVGAAIATAAVESIGMISNTENTLVIDKSKLRRAREKTRFLLQAETSDDVIGVYFDGRKDRTLVNDESNKSKINVKIEEHVTIIGEPGTTYIGHVSLKRGTSKFIADNVAKVLEEKGIHSFVAIGNIF